LQEEKLKSELEELKKIILKKIDYDIDKTAQSFASSENIFRSLRVAYSFKTVLDSIDNAFTIIGLPDEIIETKSLPSNTLKAVNGTLAVGSTLLVIENVKEDAGKLTTVFNSKSYLENVRRMLQEASATQPILGFDQTRYAEGIKFQFGTSIGQEVLSVNHRNPELLCKTSDLRNNLSLQPKQLRGTVEIRHYIIEVFKNLSSEIDATNFSDEQVLNLLTKISQIKTKILESNIRNSEIKFSDLQNIKCNFNQSSITLGRIASQQEILSNAYEALDKNLEIEQVQTVKTAFGAMTGSLQFYFNYGKGQKPNEDIKKLVEATSKVVLAIDLGDWKTEKKQTVSADELIGQIPQEMLLSLPLEFSEIVKLVDSIAFIVKKSSNSTAILPPNPIPVKLPDIPTLFLLDVSGSMEENNKIEQARESALTALQTIKDNQKKGLGNTSVSVWVFSGDDCTLQNARQILPFTPNLNLAENALRSKIPRPWGGTPLPQAVERTTNQMLSYLQNNPNLEEGRIILLSDGQSTCNQLRPADVYSQARTISIKKAVFYTIGFEVPPGSEAERDLQYLASASGGQYFPAQNQQQLARAFQKTIRVYLPKTTADSTQSFNSGVQQIVRRNYAEALKYWTIYVRTNPTDALGFYNLAITCEALGRYKTAIESYQKYLQLIGDTSDKAEIEAKIITLEQEYRDQFFYHIDLLRSDLAYLKAYYQRLFERKNNELGQEFRGFVNEKQYFYANILDVLEIKSNFLRRDTEDLTASMNVLNNRVGLNSFDRDAVSLLTIPIGQLEDLIEKLERYGNQNFK
jgi:Mg-chelatase subunit ChlD